MLLGSRKGSSMNTIIVMNAVSSLLAAVGLGGFLAWDKRRTGKAAVVPLYVRTRARPRR
jgi:hypothetical protein